VDRSSAANPLPWGDHCGDEQAHDAHRYTRGWNRYDCPGSPGCTGSMFCEAETHLHGCFADEGSCTEPREHHVAA